MEVLEVRVGERAINSKDFRQATADKGGARITPLAVTIMHGKLFRLKQLCLVCNNEEEVTAWSEGIYFFSRLASPHLYDTPIMMERFLLRRWHHLTASNTKPSIGLKDVLTFLQKINLKMAKKDIKDIFTQVDTHNLQLIGQKEFKNLYHILAEMPEVSSLFSHFSSSGSKQKLSVKDLVTFFRKEQGDKTFSEEQAERLVDRYSADGQLTVNEFVDYLHSQENDLFEPSHDMVYQDMHAPLAHYFMASSHNTYLLGDQIRSESSVEAYVRTLRDGCRCVEIDCWDGPNNDPIVYHGHTLTSKIKFSDVVRAIQEHAFVASDYPLILSIEDHSNLSQQLRMADMFKATFGDSW